MKQRDVDKAIGEAFSQYEYETTGHMVGRAKSVIDPIINSIAALNRAIKKTIPIFQETFKEIENNFKIENHESN